MNAKGKRVVDVTEFWLQCLPHCESWQQGEVKRICLPFSPGSTKVCPQRASLFRILVDTQVDAPSISVLYVFHQSIQHKHCTSSDVDTVTCRTYQAMKFTFKTAKGYDFLIAAACIHETVVGEKDTARCRAPRGLFFRPTPNSFRQVVHHAGKPVAY